MTTPRGRRGATVRAGRGNWYAACDWCGWSKGSGSQAGAQHLAELHNAHHHPEPQEAS